MTSDTVHNIQRLNSLKITNFGTFDAAMVPLEPLTVLTGSDNPTKANVINALRFLRDVARHDLAETVNMWHGMARMQREHRKVSFRVSGRLSEYASQPDDDFYTIVFGDSTSGINRYEDFSFRHAADEISRVTIKKREQWTVSQAYDPVSGLPTGETSKRKRTFANEQVTGLAALPSLPEHHGIGALAEFLLATRILQPDINKARLPCVVTDHVLSDDASNLASALLRLQKTDFAAFEMLESEMKYSLPGLESVNVAPVKSEQPSVEVVLCYKGRAGSVSLSEVSFETVRLLALLAGLHEVSLFTIIEGVDYGLPEYANDFLFDRLRETSSEGQVLVSLHSTKTVQGLKQEEIVECETYEHSESSRLLSKRHDEEPF